MFRSSSVTAPPTQPLPGVNTLVRLRFATGPATGPDGDGTGLPSRVEDTELSWPGSGPRAVLSVAAPRYRGDLEGPEPGTPCVVVWPTPSGLAELPTRFERRALLGERLRVWRLVVDGPVTRVQRRRYFRVPWFGPVTLEVRPGDAPATALTSAATGTGPATTAVPAVPTLDEPLQVLTGTTLDLSEGGLRCSLPAPGLPDGTRVRVLLRVRDEVLVLPATTVWHRPAPAHPRQLETGISFDDVERHGDLLRQVVVEEQLKARRHGVA